MANLVFSDAGNVRIVELRPASWWKGIIPWTAPVTWLDPIITDPPTGKLVLIRGKEAPTWAYSMVSHAVIARGAKAAAIYDESLKGYVVVAVGDPFWTLGQVIAPPIEG